MLGSRQSLLEKRLLHAKVFDSYGDIVFVSRSPWVLQATIPLSRRCIVMLASDDRAEARNKVKNGGMAVRKGCLSFCNFAC